MWGLIEEPYVGVPDDSPICGHSQHQLSGMWLHHLGFPESSLQVTPAQIDTWLQPHKRPWGRTAQLVQGTMKEQDKLLF